MFEQRGKITLNKRHTNKKGHDDRPESPAAILTWQASNARYINSTEGTFLVVPLLFM